MKYTVYDPPPLFVREPESIGSYEAKTRLPELLAGVEAGASYVITRHGRPVARLLPVEPPSGGAAAVEAILAARAGRRLGTSVKALIDEGRR